MRETLRFKITSGSTQLQLLKEEKSNATGRLIGQVIPTRNALVNEYVFSHVR